VSPCRALYQDLIAGSPDREKRQRDEAQTDPTAHEQLFRTVLAEIVVLRNFRKVQVAAHKKNSRAWRDEAGNRAKLATAHSSRRCLITSCSTQRNHPSSVTDPSSAKLPVVTK